MAQTPGFKYQAVLRDGEGVIMANRAVTLNVTLADGPDGNVLYKESHTISTNDLGLLNATVGEGSSETGLFSDIIGVPDLNIRIEAEISGEPDIVDAGFTKVGAAPFALYGEDADADPKNEMQELSVRGDSLKISEMGGIPLNQANYWQKTDSSYILDFDDVARDHNPTIEALLKRIGDRGTGKLKIHGDRGATGLTEESLSWYGDDLEDFKRKIGCNYEVVKDPNTGTLSVRLAHAVGQSLEGAPAEVLQAQAQAGLLLTALTFINPAFATSYIISHLFGKLPNAGQFLFPYLLKSILFQDEDPDVGPVFMESNIMVASADGPQQLQLKSISNDNYQDQVACSFENAARDLSYEVKRTDGIDFTNNAVFTDLYLRGFFALGFLVALNESARNAGDFGGTFSTANQDGLTTLTGALPGFDPATGFNMLFNGQNLGAVSTINSESAATQSLYGANGNLNVVSGTFAGTPNDGMVAIYGEDGSTLSTYMRSTASGGEVAASVFTMLAEPPGRSDKVAAFAAPVAGEAAAYDRGTARLINGEATVSCAEHFQWIADESSMTVTITPLSGESLGIAVVEKSAGSFKVQELHGGTGNYEFDYLVICKRKDQMDYQLMRDKPQLSDNHGSEILKHIPKGPMKSIQDLHR